MYIAHEIGHIILGHTVNGRICGKSTDPDTQDRQELEADAFAAYLLAPACVLFAAGITGPWEIMRAACVADGLAVQVAGEISRLKDFRQTPDEERLCRQFRRFIAQNKIRKPLKLLKYAAAVSVIAAAASCIAVSLYLSKIPDSELIPINGNSVTVYNDNVINGDEFNKMEFIEEKVYTTPSGKKFHKRACSTIKNSKNLTEHTAESALKAGYGACGVCLPLD